MLRRLIKRLFISLFLLGALGAITVIAFNLITHAAYASRMYVDAEAVLAETSRRIAIVFGAGLTRSGGPTPVLYDRVATAADLDQRGLIDKLLLTGDNRFENYNEPEAMRQTALRLGVPDSALVLDYAGRRTYDSCYRARSIFGVERAILVTQAFHLDRAMYLCASFGLDTIGVMADRRSYAASSETWWSIREAAATVAAWLDVNLLRPTPVLGEKLPIGG